MKGKYIAIIQKQIIMKIIIWWQGSYKTSTRIWKDSREMVLANLIASQIRRPASDFKAYWLISHQFARRDLKPAAFPLNNDLRAGLLNHIFSRSCSLAFYRISVQNISKKTEQKLCNGVFFSFFSCLVPQLYWKGASL